MSKAIKKKGGKAGGYLRTSERYCVNKEYQYKLMLVVVNFVLLLF